MNKISFTNIYLQMLRDWRVWVGLMLALFGSILTVSDRDANSLYERFFSQPFYFFGWGIYAIGLALVGYVFVRKLSRFISNSRERFVDVDVERRDYSTAELVRSLREEVRDLKSSQKTIDYSRLETLLNQARSSATEDDPESLKIFSKYFQSIRRVLENKSDIADKKASILLDKGTGYTKWGIVFFIVSIVTWQILAYYKGFQDQYIYGMISCSLLFIFIEFLSAWFLKQYRHFVDTSTYLIKVKAIFDRYMLAYLAVRELDKSSAGNKQAVQYLMELLRDEIQWPEYYGGKSDAGFARDAMDSISELAKAVRERNDKAK